MVPKLRRLIVGMLVFALVAAVPTAAAADSVGGGGGIQWFPWLPLLVAGIGLGIAGVAIRNEWEADKKSDEPTGEVPVVRGPPQTPAVTAGERTPPRPPPKPSGPVPE
jgi:hypothetical protein